VATSASLIGIWLVSQNLDLERTLVSDIQIGWLCCRSMMSLVLAYHELSVAPFSVSVLVKICDQCFSSFWHCSNSFLELLCCLDRHVESYVKKLNLKKKGLKNILKYLTGS
jgi:hypothetical protein